MMNRRQFSFAAIAAAVSARVLPSDLAASDIKARTVASEPLDVEAGDDAADEIERVCVNGKEIPNAYRMHIDNGENGGFGFVDSYDFTLPTIFTRRAYGHVTYKTQSGVLKIRSALGSGQRVFVR